MTNPTGEIGQLREEELPIVRVIVPPDSGGRVFEDDLDPSDLVFDGTLTPMLVWHEHYPIGRGWRSGWVLSYDTDGHGNPDDYIVGLRLPDVDAAVVQARQYLHSVGYRATRVAVVITRMAGLHAPAGHQGSGSQARTDPSCASRCGGTLSRAAQHVIPGMPSSSHPPRNRKEAEIPQAGFHWVRAGRAAQLDA